MINAALGDFDTSIFAKEQTFYDCDKKCLETTFNLFLPILGDETEGTIDEFLSYRFTLSDEL
jgi:hypothetical protein